ncbi:MAG: sigma-54-dependent Fis family transcriptional regulator [Deltaproteobacteria bacterium]|nr:sigma-54-dependent Fis family transcriptional regulator [Deltaproteobacteria bacterium]
MLGVALRRGSMSEHGRKFELLADLGALIASEVELDALLAMFASRVATAMGADRATLWLVDGATGELRSGVATALDDELRLPAGRGLAGHVAATGAVVNLADAPGDPRWAPELDRKTGYQTRSVLAVPVVRAGAPIAVIQVLNKRGGAFTAADEEFAAVLAEQIARALEYTSLRSGPGGVAVRGRFNHVIGRSAAMRAIYDLVVRAAATDATVLVRGETGTGKGLIARAIHVNSARVDGPLVAVDCTTLPAGLVESELFGHERGAYTGADSRVIGKVEAAAGGTLFLDEIGELPLELQGKLLRFVQERRFERVGGRDSLEADVRLVAATNRDLAELVRAGQFRSDLYYRLRVVELELPPLRARADDIGDLADHFATLYARKYRRTDVRISDDARAALIAHPWPGNVRELEHAIERAVVLAPDGIIDEDALALADVDPPDEIESAPVRTTATRAAVGPIADVTLPGDLTLDEVERRWAREAVTRAGGNQSAAARALGISRNKLTRLLRG